MINKLKLNDSVVIFGENDIFIIGKIDTNKFIKASLEDLEIAKKLLKGETIRRSDLNIAEENSLDKLIQFGFIDIDGDASVINPTSTPHVYLHSYRDINKRTETACNENGYSECTMNLKQILEQLVYFGIKTVSIYYHNSYSIEEIIYIFKYGKNVLNLSSMELMINSFDEKTIQSLVPYVDRISINTRTISDFHKIKDKKNKLGIKDLPLFLIQTIHKNNIHMIQNFIDEANRCDLELEFKLITCKSSCVGNLVPTDEQLINFAKQLSERGNIKVFNSTIENSIFLKRSCNALNKVLSIDSDGYVYPCDKLHSKEFNIGNLIDTPLNVILNSEKVAFLNSLTVENFSECSSCQYKYLCGGGCRARALYLKNDLKSSDKFCQMNKAYFETTLLKCTSKS